MSVYIQPTAAKHEEEERHPSGGKPREVIDGVGGSGGQSGSDDRPWKVNRSPPPLKTQLVLLFVYAKLLVCFASCVACDMRDNGVQEVVIPAATLRCESCRRPLGCLLLGALFFLIKHFFDKKSALK